MSDSTIPEIIGQLSLAEDFPRPLLNFEIVIRKAGAGNFAIADFPAAIVDDVYGVYDEINAATPGQAHPARFMRRGETKVRVQASHVVADRALVAASASDEGSAVTAASTAHAFGRALEAAPGDAEQFIRIELFADGPPHIVA